MGSKGAGHCPVSLGGWYPGTLEARATCARYPGNQPGTTAASVLHTVGVRKPSMTSSKLHSPQHGLLLFEDRVCRASLKIKSAMFEADWRLSPAPPLCPQLVDSAGADTRVTWGREPTSGHVWAGFQVLVAPGSSSTHPWARFPPPHPLPTHSLSSHSPPLGIRVQ